MREENMLKLVKQNKFFLVVVLDTFSSSFH